MVFQIPITACSNNSVPSFINSTAVINRGLRTDFKARSSIKLQKWARTHVTCRTNDSTPAKLVTAPWLADQLKAGKGDEITILDVRGRVVKSEGRVEQGTQPVDYVADDNDYFAAHIPMAKFVDWRKIDLADHVQFCDDMAQLGVCRTRPICVYDWGDMLFATRLWLALVSMSCEDVAVVNGGWASWDALGGEVSLNTPCPLTSYSEFDTLLEESKRPHMSVSLNEMRDIVQRHKANDAETLIVDARSVKQFSGIERRSKRAGHIPGAINLPYRSLLNDDGIGLREDAALEQILRSYGANQISQGHRNGVCYCNGGVASSMVLFCLVRCGAPWGLVRNYCGSFNEWGNLTDTPIVDMQPNPRT